MFQIRELPCVRVPASEAEHVIRALKARGLYADGYKAKRLADGVVAIPLNEGATREALREFLSNYGAVECFEGFEGGVGGLTFKDLLKGLIPEEDLRRVPSSYTIIGDVAVINLPEDLMAYGGLIGEAIANVSRGVRAVYAGSRVVGEYRVKRLKHVYGDAVSKTVHKEYGLSISVDVVRTYYNSSLSEEHRRVAKLICDGEVIADLFCGVGPFSLHAASLRRVVSYAVDFNPDALKCLLESIDMNGKVLKGRVVPVLDDVADFLDLVRDGSFSRVIMNLPHKALEYLPLSHSKVREGGVIHLYVISSSGSGAVEDVRRVSDNLGLSVVGVKRVLDYAPRKYVYRVDLVRDERLKL